MASSGVNWDNRMSRRLKLRDLYVLSTVVQQGSMAKGAAHLGMSQPAVSEAIATLEAALRVRLLDRSPRGIEPTIYARALLKRGHVIFDELRLGLQDIDFLSNQTVGAIRIGSPESLATGFVPAVIERLVGQHPQVTVDVVNAQTSENEFKELHERSVDLMLGRLLKPLAQDDIEAEPLFQDGFSVVAGTRSPWAARKNIELTELMDEPWVYFPSGSVAGAHVAEAFLARGLEPPKSSVTSFSIHLRMQLLASGRFISILHKSVVHYNAERWSLKELPVDLGVAPAPVAIFRLKNRTLSPVVQLFVEQARAVSETLALYRHD